MDLHHPSTIPRRAQARRSSAGHYAKRFRRDGVKASIYQAQGKLQQAAGLLSETNGQKLFEQIFATKVTQLRLERNYGEAIRSLQARLAQFPFASEIEKAFFQLNLAFMQRLAGDTAGAELTAEQARTTYEQRHRDQPAKGGWLSGLSLAYAAMG